MMWAVLPLKRFQHAKRRLKDTLTPSQREAFFRAMVEDVLAALRSSERLAGTLVVSPDGSTRVLAERFAAEWLAECGPTDLNGAIGQAARHLEARGASGVMVVPGDVPLITGAEIDALIASHGAAPSVSVVPAADDGGTNALLVSPPTLIEFAYGAGSCARHLAAARAAGVEPKRLESPGFGLDIDRPADLTHLLESKADRRSVRFLKATFTPQSNG